MKILREKKTANYLYTDLSTNCLTKGDVYDEYCLNQSIQNILSTAFGERIFNNRFGSKLPTTLFETMDNQKGQSLVDSIVKSIEFFEDRILVVKDAVKFVWESSKNLLTIDIPYVIVKTGKIQNFSRKVSV